MSLKRNSLKKRVWLVFALIAFLFVGNTYAQSTKPIITSFTPDSGPIGESVIISGSNFSVNTSENIVFFGGVKTEVLQASATELVVNVPKGAAYAPISVLTNNLTGTSVKPFSVTFESDRSITAIPKSFDDVISTTASGGPYFIVPSDFDDDGKLDLLLGNYDDAKYSVYLNASTGEGNIAFASPYQDVLGNSSNEFVVADFNNDGKPDFAQGGELGTSGVLSVWENNYSASGTSGFLRRELLGLSNAVTSIAAGDFDQDGKIDLVYANGGTTTVSVLKNTSSGSISMATAVDFAVGNNPYKVTVADLNQDGLPDIVALNQDDNSLSILENKTLGGVIVFDLKVDFAINSSSTSEWLTIGDLNADGLPDVVVRNSSSFSVLENQSSSSFSFGSPVETITGVGAGIATLDDFNGDAKPDLLISSFSNLGIYVNSSIGTSISFDAEAAVELASARSASAAVSVDLDGDGEPDLITTSYEAFIGSGEYLEIARNRHSGTALKSFSFDEQDGEAVIDVTNRTITIEVNAPNLENLIATFETSYGAEVKIGAQIQTSEVTANDFTNPVIYTLTAEDGISTEDWTVNVALSCIPHAITKSISACNSYEFDGSELTESGNYTGLFTNSDGCDSTVNLELTIHEVEFVHHIYSEDAYEFNGEMLTESGQYMATLTSNATGCDSLVTLNLTIESEEDSYPFFELSHPSGTPQLYTDIANLGGLIAAGDLDGDGDLDVITSGVTNNTGDLSFSVSYETVLYWNDGAGNLSRDEALLEEMSAWIEIADFDQDNDLDVLLAGSSLNSYYLTRLYVNDGSGHFQLKSDHGLPGFRAGSTYVKDMDLMNGPDVVLQGILEDGTYMAKIFYNQGNGVFDEYDESVLTGLWGGNAGAEDVDGDGDLDLVMTGRDASSNKQLFIYFKEDGTYQQGTGTGLNLPTSYGREQVHFIDVDQNNTMDVIIGQYLFLNDGTGSFTVQTEGLSDDITRPQTIAQGDLNGDGLMDLMVTGADKIMSPFEAITQFYLRDAATGGFTFSQEVVGAVAGAATLADLNDDGVMDLITSGYTSSTYQAEVETFINDGAGQMNKVQLEPFDMEMSEGDAHFYDFDGDGDQDLIVGGENEEKDFTTNIYWNDGSGNYTLDTKNDLAESKFTLILEDFDGDEHIDIVTTYQDGNHLYLGDGTGTFTEKTDANLGDNYEPSGDAADIDGDGDMDLIIIGSTNPGIFRNDGTGVFSKESGPFIQMYSSKVRFADVDDDGDVDVFITGDPRASGIPHQAKLYLNDGTGSFTEDTINKFLGTQSPTANFADVDGDGDMDLFLSGDTGSQQISRLYLNDGKGLFTLDASSDIVGIYIGDSEFADLDGDGDEDLVLTGHNRTDRTNYTRIYYNNGWGHFEEDTKSQLLALNNSLLAIGDADGDGMLDIFVSGADNGKQTRIYLNTTCQDTTEELIVESVVSYEFFGELLTSTGMYTHSEPLRCGKSHITKLDLTIIEISGEETVEVCESYEWNAVTYTESGTYQAVFTDELGIDSTATLHLTVFGSASSYDTIQACNHYVWNDSTYTESGDYSIDLTSVNGCDSTSYLNLDILLSDSSDFEVSAFGSYTWNEVTYETTGSYQQIFQNTAGCDSVVTLTLEVIPFPVADFIIGGSEAAHFESFEAAVAYLTEDHTYTENVVVAVEPGTYPESVTISELGNEDYEVIFEGEEAASVIIQPVEPTISGLFIQQMDHLTFSNMTIDMGQVSSSLVQFDGNEIQSLSIQKSTNILIDQVTLINTGFDDFREDTMVPIATAMYLNEVQDITISNSSSRNTGTHLVINDYEDVTVIDNQFEVAHRMIKVGRSGDELANELYVAGNRFEGKASVLAVGFKLTGSTDSSISDITFNDNVIEVEADSFSDDVFFEGSNLSEVLFQANNFSFGYEGFEFTEVTDLSFIGNIIEGTQNAIKIDDYATVKLYNNDIQIKNQYALWLVSGNDLDLIHNSLYATEFSGYATTRIRILGGTNRIQNNIFGCSEANANHMGLNLIDIEADELTLDHNLYDANAQQPLVIGNLKLSGNRVFNSSDFSEWQAAQQLFDQNSQSFHTEFESSLSLNSPKDFRFGGYTETISNDLIGNIRTAELGIDVGAYQHCGYYQRSTIEICGETYEFNGQVLNAAGYYEVGLTASSGCDSIASIDLVFREQFFTETLIESCGTYSFGTQELSASGIYLETFTSLTGCDSVVSLTYEQLPDPSTEIMLEGNTLALVKQETGDSYQWINCDTGEEIQAATTADFTPNANGQYAVKVSNGSCEVVSGCMTFERNSTILSTDQSAKVGVRMYPNPTKEIVYIDLEQATNVEVSLIALDGRVLLKKEFEPYDEIRIVLPKPGVYVVQIIEKETEIASRFTVSRIR